MIKPTAWDQDSPTLCVGAPGMVRATVVTGGFVHQLWFIPGVGGGTGVMRLMSQSLTLGLQVPSEKVFGVGLEGPNTF